MKTSYNSNISISFLQKKNNLPHEIQIIILEFIGVDDDLILYNLKQQKPQKQQLLPSSSSSSPSNFSLDSIKIIENYIDINNITVINTTNSNDSNTMNSNEAESSWKTYNQNQCPTILKLRGLPYNQPWWQEQDNIRNYLESNIEIITNEFMHLYNHPCHHIDILPSCNIHDNNDCNNNDCNNVIDSGTIKNINSYRNNDNYNNNNNSINQWKVLYLIDEGIMHETNLSLCPFISDMFKSIQSPLSNRLCLCPIGYAYFSILPPNTQIRSHYGTTNAKLRIQLPLNTISHQPKQQYHQNQQQQQNQEHHTLLDSYITVNNEIKQYEIGKIITFDDSYRHSVRNVSMHQERVVLLIDIWHPYLTASLIHELSTCFHNFTRTIKLTNGDDDDDTNFNNNKHNQHDYDYTMKAIVIGNRCVGKSKFIMRACNDKFDDSYMISLLQFESSLLTIQNKIIKMRIWDYSSPERYRAMSSSYYRLANVIFVLFESTESIHTCSFWINEIKKYAPEKSIIVIVRSKMDLVLSASVSSSLPSTTATEAAISQIELDEFFSIHGKLPYHEISSKTGYGIKSVLHSAVKLFLQRRTQIPNIEQNMKGISNINKKSNAYCLIL